MRKTFILIIIFSFLTILSNNLSAKDIGQNASKGKVISIYDEKEKSLVVYGNNLNGNLGNGTYKDIIEENKVKINDKIGNRKIIDYFIDEKVTYVLTEDNKLYTSGTNVADSLSGRRNTFINVVIYKNNTIKKTSINGKSNYTEKKGDFFLEVKTATKNVTYNYTINYAKDIPLTAGKDNKYSSMDYDDVYTSMIYTQKKDKGLKYIVILRRNGKFGYRENDTSNGTWCWDYRKNGVLARKYYEGMGKKYFIEKEYNYYKNGKINDAFIRYLGDSEKVKYDIEYYTKYNTQGKRVYGDVTKFFNDGDKYYEIWQKVYSYKKGKLNTRKIYKNKKQKLYLYSLKEYKQKKNGKKYYYITYYKYKKAYKSYYYQLNKKGKVINKKQVKTRK